MTEGRRQFGLPEKIALALYAVLVGLLARSHQPWLDEAQAWLIARDSGLREIFVRRLHYEGTPGLWHLLLWVLTRLHFSYAAMHAVVAAIGVATAWIILRYSPFPRVFRLGLPFVFGFVYQTAIIARSYSLVPLLAFTLCILLGAKKDRPILFSVIAGLLANCVLFSAVMSAGFVAFYIWRKILAPGVSAVHEKRQSIAPGAQQYVLAGVVLLLLWSAAIYTAIPAPDVTYGMGKKIPSHPALAHVLSGVTGIPGPLPQKINLSSDQQPDPPTRPVGLNAWQSWVWDNVGYGQHPSKPWLLLRKTIAALSFAFYPVSSSNALAAAFYLFLLLWLWRHSILPAALPFLFTWAACCGLGFNAHHASMPLTALVGSIWLARDAKNDRIRTGWIDHTFAVLALLVMAEQILWTASAVRIGRHEPFDASVETAHFIDTEVGQKEIAGFNHHTTTVMPYFHRRVFFDIDTSYWPWTLAADPDTRVNAIIGERPPFILVGETVQGPVSPVGQVIPRGAGQTVEDTGTLGYLIAHRYHVTHRFCGMQPAHFSYSEVNCLIVLEPQDLGTTRH
jgi:hypothetical protein